MCDVMCDVLSQPSTFQVFDTKTEMDELSFFTVRSVHAVHDAKTQPKECIARDKLPCTGSTKVKCLPIVATHVMNTYMEGLTSTECSQP